MLLSAMWNSVTSETSYNGPTMDMFVTNLNDMSAQRGAQADSFLFANIGGVPPQASADSGFGFCASL